MSAVLFVAEAGDLRRFKNTSELEKYAGSNLRLWESGVFKGRRRLAINVEFILGIGARSHRLECDVFEDERCVDTIEELVDAISKLSSVSPSL